MDLAVGFVTTVSLLALGLPAAGSILLGVSVSLLGLLFAALAALVAQVTENTRIVNGLIGVVLGMSFVVRGVGDINGGTWSWCSPIGWAQKTRPFAGDAWWPLLVVVTCAATAGLGAAALSRRRDLGGALLRPRAGPARATASLGHPLGLAFRLHRGVIAGWALGVVAIGAAYGSIGDTIDQYVVDNKAMADLLSLSRGASVTDAYFATATSFTALLVAGYALQAALRPRTEEAAARACAVVVAGVSRRAWLLSHAAVTALGTVSVLAVGGMGTGIAYGVVSGHWSKALAVAVAAWAYVPAVWVLAAIAFALVGSAPRATLLAWLTLAWCVTVGLLGELLHIPTWARDLSPIELVPRVPASAWSLRPLVAMVVAAGLLLFAGVHAFGRRDIDVG
jgi:ABC-2 type transport system permease protein